MGQLFEAVQEIDRCIEELGLEPFKTKGAIGMQAGFFLVVINADTPDDPQRLYALRQAANEVLGVPLRC